MKVPISTEIYLNFGRRILIPVNPEEITIDHPSNNKTYEILGVGEVVVPMSPGLIEASWESYLPSDGSNPFAASDISPTAIVGALTAAKNGRQPGRLIIIRSGLFDTNIRCIIETLEFRDRGGEPGDIYYRIGLKEYRDYSPETVEFVIPEEIHTLPAEQPVEPTPTPTTTTETSPVKKAAATVRKERPIEKPTVTVGAEVLVNGMWYRTSKGQFPSRPVSNYPGVVGRISAGDPYPVYIKGCGWMQESDVSVQKKFR